MNSLEAKVVILGAQGAGKTSLVVRFVENNFHRNMQSTIGASFLVKKVYPSFISPFLLMEGKWMIVLYGCKFGTRQGKNGFALWYSYPFFFWVGMCPDIGPHVLPRSKRRHNLL